MKDQNNTNRQKDHLDRTALSIINEVARARDKESLARIIGDRIKSTIHFDDSFILRYDALSGTCSPYIYYHGSKRLVTDEFQSHLYINYKVADGDEPPFVVDVEESVRAGDERVAFIHSVGVRELVAIELRDNKTPIGVFVLLSDRKGTFQQNDLDLLQEISQAVAIATSNIILNQELSERENEKTALFFLSQDIVTVRTRADLLGVLRTKLKEMFSITGFGMTVLNEKNNSHKAFIVDLEAYVETGLDLSEPLEWEHSIKDGIYEHIASSQTPIMLIVEDLVDMKAAPKYVELWQKLGIKKVFGMALRIGDEIQGCLFFHLDPTKQVPISPMLFKGVCTQISIAVSNILNNEEIINREEEKTILLSLSNKIAALRSRNDLQYIFNAKFKELFSITEFGIAQVNQDGKTYQAFVLDLSPEIMAKPGYQKATESIYQTSDLIFARTSASTDPVLFEVEKLLEEDGIPDYVHFWHTAGIKRVLCVALRVGGKLIGSTNLHLDNRPSTSLKINLLKGVCAQLGLAVSNIIANEEIVNREAEKSLLLSLSNEIAALRNRNHLHHIVNTRLKNLFCIETFSIAQVNKDGKTYSSFIPDMAGDILGFPGFGHLTTDSYEISDYIFSTTSAAQEPVVFEVDELIKKKDIPAYVQLWKAAGLRRTLCVALRVGGKVIGSANLHLDPDTNSPINTNLLMGVCAQLGVAISNILANEEIAKREEEKSKLLSFSNAIISVRNKNLLSKILKSQLQALFNITDYVIHALSDDQKTHHPILFDPEADFAVHPDFLKMVHLKTDINDGIFDTILDSERMVIFDAQRWEESDAPPTYSKAAKAIGLKRMIGLKLCVGKDCIAIMNFRQKRTDEYMLEEPLFNSISAQIAMMVSNIIANEKVSDQLNEINKYKEQLEEERIYLKEEIETSLHHAEIIGESREMRKIFRLVDQVSPSDSTVLILGETGTGKELIARAIHNGSPRKEKLMVKVNCAALPPNLIESELFGHERGSFTGAFERRIGKFELANNGTLFLDEIGEMPMELQVKLLRALQEKEIERIGGKTTIRTDVRIIAATNRDLNKLMDEGKFRTDLYYRLNIFPIDLPPLRHRSEDIPALASHFILRYSKKAGKKIGALSNKVLQELMQYSWPGNIRELEHLIERNVLIASGNSIREIQLPQQKAPAGMADSEIFTIRTIDENEKDYILKVLRFAKGKVSGDGGAAELLGLPPSTLNSRMKRLGIKKEHIS